MLIRTQRVSPHESIFRSSLEPNRRGSNDRKSGRVVQVNRCFWRLIGQAAMRLSLLLLLGQNHSAAIRSTLEEVHAPIKVSPTRSPGDMWTH
jgi:hypothetical protein